MHKENLKSVISAAVKDKDLKNISWDVAAAKVVEGYYKYNLVKEFVEVDWIQMEC